MRFLADENFPGTVVQTLQEEGHSVFWARIDSPGEKDGILLSRASREERIVLTFDKDFGELAFRFGLPARAGIILFRLSSSSPRRLRDRVLSALREKITWTGHFAVVEENRIRLTPLPPHGKKGSRAFEGGGPPIIHESAAAYGMGRRTRKSKAARKKARS